GVLRNGRVTGVWPGPGAIALTMLLFLCAVLILYSMWIMIICAAFYFIRVDNLLFLFTSVFDFARWPRSVFRGALSVLFTYVVPLTLLTSYPAEALLRRLSGLQVLWAVFSTAVLLTASRLIWQRAIRHYTSASS